MPSQQPRVRGQAGTSGSVVVTLLSVAYDASRRADAGSVPCGTPCEEENSRHEVLRCGRGWSEAILQLAAASCWGVLSFRMLLVTAHKGSAWGMLCPQEAGVVSLCKLGSGASSALSSCGTHEVQRHFLGLRSTGDGAETGIWDLRPRPTKECSEHLALWPRPPLGHHSVDMPPSPIL